MIDFNSFSQVDLRDKKVLITGANSGLGFECAKFFAMKQAEVYLCARSIDKGLQAQANIQAEYPEARLHFIQLDLADHQSIHTCVESVKSLTNHIDILINNAGLMAVPYQKTPDGYEMQMGVNHLGHMRLTLLLDQLLYAGSRIVNVSSMAYLQGKLDQENMMFESGKYQAFKSYANSKLANLLFTHGLTLKFKKEDRDILVVSAHPGIAKTALFDADKQGFLTATLVKLLSFMLPTAYEGAKALITASIDPEAKDTNYYGPHQSKRHQGNQVKLESLNHFASDVKLVEDFWDWSMIQLNKTENLT